MPNEDEYMLSMGGQRIYQHTRETEGPVIPEASCIYLEDIEQYAERAFGKREGFVLHEILSDLVHIDILVLMPTEEDDRHILITSGMSDLPMTMPPELLPKFQHLQRAELVMFLPGSWDVRSDDEQWYWPIRLMKTLARLPHEYKTWLGYGHSIPNGPDEAPYAASTKLCGAVLYDYNFEDGAITAADGTQIQVYMVVPVYRQEMNYKLRHDADKLLDKLIKAGLTTTLNIKRKNSCSLF